VGEWATAQIRDRVDIFDIFGIGIIAPSKKIRISAKGRFSQDSLETLVGV